MSDLRAFFCDLTDALIEHSKREAFIQRVCAKQKQIQRIEEKRCGNCVNWMTSKCIPEQKDRRIRSMNDSCITYFEGGKYDFLKEKFQKELDAMLSEDQEHGEGERLTDPPQGINPNYPPEGMKDE